MKTIGEKIKSIRKTNKLNQIQFSQIIGVSQGTLSELEQDKYKPSLETIVALKLNFNVNLEWMLIEEYISSNSTLFCTQLDNLESNLISEFRKLNVGDKHEIQEIINLKLKRYKYK